MFLFYIFVLITEVRGEVYNLYGVGGQAYALEISIGHPPQKVQNIKK